MWKRTIILIAVLVLGASIAHAEPLVTLFANQSSVSTGDLVAAEAKDHTVFCNFSTTGVSAITVKLTGSLDNDNYEDLATHAFSAGELSAESAMFHVADKTVNSVKGSVSAVTKTGDLFLDCYYKAYRP